MAVPESPENCSTQELDSALVFPAETDPLPYRRSFQQVHLIFFSPTHELCKQPGSACQRAALSELFVKTRQTRLVEVILRYISLSVTFCPISIIGVVKGDVAGDESHEFFFNGCALNSVRSQGAIGIGF